MLNRRWAFAAVAFTLALTAAACALGTLKEFGNLRISYAISEAEIEVLEDREYYTSLIQDIRDANDEILVAMYSLKYDPDDPEDWANDLIEELVSAKERGVDDRVIIEYRTYWGYMDDNLEAYNYLEDNGVDVKLDMDTETDHFKFVVIDGRIAYVGSHNWSESGLYYNREVSIRIVDEGVAGELKEYFNSLWE